MFKYDKKFLEKLILNDALSYEAIGRIYNVTGAAIKKAAKRLGMPIVNKKHIQKYLFMFKK